MSQALYRKWRPARFNQVIGQEHVTHTLQNAVAAGRIGHAYLFSGPRGTGKTTTARLLAKAANCLHSDLTERPCDECAPCQAVDQSRFLDLIEIDAASNTGVDDIRDLRDKINFAPSQGRFKVYIIDEVHMLSTAAFNALLKTLEEPPPHAMFVLATTEEHKVPLTIKSRCQQFNFRLLTTQEIIGRLNWLTEQEDLSVEKEALLMIARHGNGSLRDAESLLDQLVTVPGDTITLKRAQMVLGTASNAAINSLTNAVLAGDGAAGLEIIHQALGSGTDARQFAHQMVDNLRLLLLLQTAGGTLDLDITAEQQAELAQQSQYADRRALIEAVKRFNEAATTQSGSWQPQLPLELAFIELLPEVTGAAKPAAPPVTQVKQQPVPAAAPPIESKPSRPKKEKKAKAQTAAAVEPAALEEIESAVKTAEATETKPISAQAPKTAAGGKGPTLQAVTTRWPEMRERVGKVDKNLQALLASCKPMAVEGTTLILGFDFPLLREKFDKKKAETIADIFSSLLETKCTVRTVITSEYEPPKTTKSIEEDFVALADELGGVVRDG
jgi:DNA polymerase-3 subunit gamma/tau